MKTTFRCLVSAAGLSVGVVSALGDDSSPSLASISASFQKTPLANQSIHLEGDQRSKPVDSSASSVSLTQSTKVSPLSERNLPEDSPGSAAAQAVDLPKVTIFAENLSGLGQTDMYTAKGLAEMARKLHPEMTFKGQRGIVSLALFQAREEERLVQINHYTQVMTVAAQENPQDKAEKKKMQDEINQTFLRQRDSTTEFLNQFYVHR